MVIMIDTVWRNGKVEQMRDEELVLKIYGTNRSMGNKRKTTDEKDYASPADKQPQWCCNDSAKFSRTHVDEDFVIVVLDKDSGSCNKHVLPLLENFLLYCNYN